jgi:hypothetical protein
MCTIFSFPLFLDFLTLLLHFLHSYHRSWCYTLHLGVEKASSQGRDRQRLQAVGSRGDSFFGVRMRKLESDPQESF